jgi:hypothetical protein
MIPCPRVLLPVTVQQSARISNVTFRSHALGAPFIALFAMNGSAGTRGNNTFWEGHGFSRAVAARYKRGLQPLGAALPTGQGCWRKHLCFYTGRQSARCPRFAPGLWALTWGSQTPYADGCSLLSCRVD